MKLHPSSVQKPLVGVIISQDELDEKIDRRFKFGRP